MQSPDIIFPPIEYLFLQREQPDEQTWQAIEQFGNDWNTSHQSQFANRWGNGLSVILAEGINDPELITLDEAIKTLKTTAGIKYVRGAVDNRNPEDFENAPWVQIVSDQYPAKTYENFNAAFTQPERCERCHTQLRTGKPTGTPLIFDEAVLDKKVEDSPDFDPPGPDLISLPNRAMLVSIRVVNLLSTNNITGYELLNVLSKATKQPSQRVFLLQTQKAIMDACSEHTPRDPGAICPVCGNVRIGVLGNFYIREEWLEGAALFSRNPSHLSELCVSNRLYKILKESGCKGMLPSNGLFSCRHTK